MSERSKVLGHLQQLDLRKPADMIIDQIRELIASGVVKAGEKLPSERELALRFGVGRGHVREALRRLEFYGVITTRPQIGAVVEDMTAGALDTLIANVLTIQVADVGATMEVRQILEEAAARKAAEIAGVEEMAAIRTAHDHHRQAVEDGRDGIEADLKFHLAVAQGAGNGMLRMLISLLAPQIVTLANRYNTCTDGRAHHALEEHEAILRAIARNDPDAAAHAMRRHLVMTKSKLPGDTPPD